MLHGIQEIAQRHDGVRKRGARWHCHAIASEVRRDLEAFVDGVVAQCDLGDLDAAVLGRTRTVLHRARDGFEEHEHQADDECRLFVAAQLHRPDRFAAASARDWSPAPPK